MAKMKFDTFVRNCTKKLQEILNDYSVELQFDSNGQGCGWFVHRIGIRHGSIIYANHFYERYLAQDTFGSIVNGIAISCYIRLARLDTRYDTQVPQEFVYFQLTSIQNKDILQDSPYCLWEDLAVVFRGTLAGNAAASIRITNVTMELFHLDQNGLYRCALQNAPILLPYTLKPIINSELPEVHFWVLTNQQRIDGAACLLYPGMLGVITRCVGGSYWIIPTSIHEVLITPYCGDLGEEEFFNKMLQDMNHMGPKEVTLSDHVYLYDAEIHTITYRVNGIPQRKDTYGWQWLH